MKSKSCLIKQLDQSLWLTAADAAIKQNPSNAPPVASIPDITALHIAVMTAKYWGSDGHTFTVSFLDNPANDLKNKILSYMNLWSIRSNVKFVLAKDAEVRIARVANDGYWSYLGTDILSIPKNKATMNLGGFTMKTPESEYDRVVTHETGHTLGFPHEHMRKAIIDRLDVNKTIAYFKNYYGWPESMTRQQVLTPIDESELIASQITDIDSIMCYQLPASITKDGIEIPGGLKINEEDYKFANRIYPQTVKPISESLNIDVTNKVVKIPPGWKSVQEL